MGLAVQAIEGQERLAPVITENHAIIPDSGGPGQWRGGCGTQKGGTLTQGERTVMSYCCDRARSVPWGLNGGLPSMPHGLWYTSADTPDETKFLGAQFSGVPLAEGDHLTRPAAGGGGYGDPLKRAVADVLEDVIDGYVTLRRAERDYGVVPREIDPDLAEYEIDHEATAAAREDIAEHRHGWLAEDASDVARRYRAGELDMYDVIRRHAVILDWGTGELHENSTTTFRKEVAQRMTQGWEPLT